MALLQQIADIMIPGEQVEVAESLNMLADIAIGVPAEASAAARTDANDFGFTVAMEAMDYGGYEQDSSSQDEVEEAVEATEATEEVKKVVELNPYALPIVLQEVAINLELEDLRNLAKAFPGTEDVIASALMKKEARNHPVRNAELLGTY